MKSPNCRAKTFFATIENEKVQNATERIKQILYAE